MSDKGKGIHLLPGLSAVAITMLLASFSATQRRPRERLPAYLIARCNRPFSGACPVRSRIIREREPLRPETRAWAPGWRPAQST